MSLLLLLLTGLAGQSELWAQVTFEIRELPINSPKNPELYLAASFNQWQTDAPAYRFEFHHSGTYRLTVPDLQPPFEYKITQGNWRSAEADLQGNDIPNRMVDRIPRDGVIPIRIKGWLGQPQAQPIDSVRLVIESVPTNTPEDAKIYVAGTFNSWQTDLPRFQMQPQGDGSYALTVPIYRDTVQYKFTRGNWSSVEGRRSGRARFNRQLILPPLTEPTVRVQILSWEDLSGTLLNGYTVFWLMAAIQGLLIIIAINTIENNNLSANRRLSALLLIMSLALIGRVVVYDREVFNWYPKLILLPDLIYFLYAPIFIQYILRLLRYDPEKPDKREWLHFLPFGLHLMAYLPLLLMDSEAFINRAVNLELRPIFILVGGIALVYNLAYWFYARRLIRAYQYDSDHTYSGGSNLQFLNTILTLKGICLLIWAFAYAVGGYGWLTDTSVIFLTDRATDVLWIGFSLTAFLLGYFAMKEPEIFKLPQPNERALPEPIPLLPNNLDPLTEAPNEEKSEAQDEKEDWEPIRQKLTQLMDEQQPYLNPKLTLPELADQAGETVHDLSRAINQGFGMNFNDFVNSYRVDAFKEKVLEPQYRNHTLLAVALMVGFNSKTAFNRSFKKLTGQTPREYFQAEKEKNTSVLD